MLQSLFYIHGIYIKGGGDPENTELSYIQVA